MAAHSLNKKSYRHFHSILSTYGEAAFKEWLTRLIGVGSAEGTDLVELLQNLGQAFPAHAAEKILLEAEALELVYRAEMMAQVSGDNKTQVPQVEVNLDGTYSFTKKWLVLSSSIMFAVFRPNMTKIRDFVKTYPL